MKLTFELNEQNDQLVVRGNDADETVLVVTLLNTHAGLSVAFQAQDRLNNATAIVVCCGGCGAFQGEKWIGEDTWTNSFFALVHGARGYLTQLTDNARLMHTATLLDEWNAIAK